VHGVHLWFASGARLITENGVRLQPFFLFFFFDVFYRKCGFGVPLPLFSASFPFDANLRSRAPLLQNIRTFLFFDDRFDVLEARCAIHFGSLWKRKIFFLEGNTSKIKKKMDSLVVVMLLTMCSISVVWVIDQIRRHRDLQRLADDIGHFFDEYDVSR
jgi:hypothetical protein